MSPSIGRRLVSAVAVFCLMATFTTACRSDDPSNVVGEATAKIQAGSATTLTAAGITVTVPDGGAAEGPTVKLTVTEGVESPLLAEGLDALGPSVTVDVPGGLIQPATVTFPAPPGVDDESVIPVVAWQDGVGEWRWVPTTYDASQGTVSATVDHFSFGFLGGIDVKKWVSDRWDSFRNFITGRAGAAQPRCGDEAAARANGVQVTSDRGDRVKWCFGVENGRRVLKVTNNTRTYLQITYPETWRVADGASVSLDFDTVARALGAAVSKPSGTAARIVDGGDTLTLIVPDGASGRVTVESSVVAWTVSAIFFGAETYALVARAAGSTLGTAARNAVDRLAVLLGATSEATPEVRALSECLKGMRGLVTLETADTAWETLKFAWKCVPELMKSQLQDVRIFAAGVVLSMVGTAVGAILTAAHLLVTGARDLWDHIASLGGRSDAIYDIVIDDPAAVLNAYVGKYEWSCGDGYIGIEIGPDRTGRMESWTFKEGTMESRLEVLAIRLVLKQGTPTIVVDRVIQPGYGTSTPVGTEYTVQLIDGGKALRMNDFFTPIPREGLWMEYPC
ncbi:MAG: hypothetical protein IRY85_19925 [Micromonosporaceae bacterium]|nr:hypothetical protein [Micromonosporaceae bacterium]